MKKWIDKLLRKLGYVPILKSPTFQFKKEIFHLMRIKNQRIVSTIQLNDPVYEDYQKFRLAEGILHEIIPLMDYSCEYYSTKFSPDRTEKIMKYEIYIAVKQK